MLRLFKKKTFYNKINTTFAHDFICIQKRDKSAKTQIFNIHIHNDLTRIHICAMWWLWTWFCKRLSQNSIFNAKIHIRACDISTRWSVWFWYGNHGICQVVESYMFHKRAFLYVRLRLASFHERCWTWMRIEKEWKNCWVCQTHLFFPSFFLFLFLWSLIPSISYLLLLFVSYIIFMFKVQTIFLQVPPFNLPNPLPLHPINERFQFFFFFFFFWVNKKWVKMDD